MITHPELWLLDTNVWVFGLRADLTFPACRELLDAIGSFRPLVPLQIIREINAALSKEEVRKFYDLVNEHPGLVILDWTKTSTERITFFETRGCRKGDAVIASHAEQFGIKFVVSENRQFLQTVTGLQFKVITPQEALLRLR